MPIAFINTAINVYLSQNIEMFQNNNMARTNWITITQNIQICGQRFVVKDNSEVKKVVTKDYVRKK